MKKVISYSEIQLVAVSHPLPVQSGFPTILHDCPGAFPHIEIVKKYLTKSYSKKSVWKWVKLQS